MSDSNPGSIGETASILKRVELKPEERRGRSYVDRPMIGDYEDRRTDAAKSAVFYSNETLFRRVRG